MELTERTCPHCGMATHPESLFCAHCGKPIVQNARPATEQQAGGLQCDMCGAADGKPRFFAYYDRWACKPCHYSLINRRAGAGIIDIALLYFLSFALGFAIGQALGGDEAVVGLAGFAGFALSIAYWLTKDAWFEGRSIGKLICGIRVVDRRTGNPISVAQCAQRNLPLFIPFMPLVAAIQINGGDSVRIGDGWAGTKVTKG